MNQNAFKVEIIKSHPTLNAQVKKISTPHGTFLTPVFMSVGTRAFVNCMRSDDLITAGSQIILGGNTYHMLCSPGLGVIESLGGMHQCMDWHHPMLTDSGGFQVFSLSKNSKICKINDLGAEFRHPTSGKVIRLNSFTSLQAQKIIGADIIMAFDQCTEDSTDEGLITQAMERTHQWLIQSKDYHEDHPNSAYGFKQALFGIVQGAYHKALRQACTEIVLSHHLDGIAIGGESIGFDMDKTCEILDWVTPMIPKALPLYTMGVGLQPQDLIRVVAKGVDMFDCVAPTRNARHGALFVGKVVEKGEWIDFESEEPNARINIGKSLYAEDKGPLMEHCDCMTCQHYSRGYLHYLFRTKSSIYYNLATIHNVHVMNSVCTAMRNCILNA